jgi:hypothetical protein
LAVLAALAVTGLVVAGRLGASSDSSETSTASGSSGSSGTTAPKISYPKAWDARVAPIAAFVEGQRRLTYKHPVRVDFLAPAVFARQLTSEVEGDKSDADLQNALYRIQGLVGPNFDLYAAAPDLLIRTVIGLYIPETKRVIVRGDQLTPAARTVLAHELTHALQDQYFDLGRDFARSGQLDSFRAAAEADAVSVEDAYRATLSPADQAAADAAEKADAPTAAQLKRFPPALFDVQAFPYVVGPTFLDAVRAARGQAGVDEALAHPPSRDAEILQPDRYLNKTPVVAATVPSLGPGEEEVESADLGELGLLELLGSHGPFAAAWYAVQAYSDDAGIAYTRNGTICQRVAVTFIGAAAADRFVAASGSWTRSVRGAKAVRTATGVQLDACDPGPAAPPTPTASVLDRVQFRAGGLAGLKAANRKISATRADCIATTTASALTGPQLDLIASDPPDSQLGFFQPILDAAAKSCPR